MKTPSHAILNLALLGKPHLPQANLPIVLGAILPDIPIFIFYFWAKLVLQLPETQIWSEAYYQPFWQNIIALFHSIPLAAIGGLFAYYRGWQIGQIFFLSLVLHSLLDLPVHNDDAHRHFFPFSNYRFISPLSYWDSKHHGDLVSFIETLLVLGATVYNFGLVQSRIGKGLMIAINLLYWLSYLPLLSAWVGG